VVFTNNLQRHEKCPPTDASGATVCKVLNVVFAEIPRLRGYILDETGCLRKHMSISVDGELVKDRRHLSDPIEAHPKIYVMRALSGG
jgi:hypothetical protein